MQFKLVFFLASTVAAVLGVVPVGQCIDYLQEVENSARTLTSGIQNLDHTNLIEAWNIHANAGKAQAAVEQAATCIEFVKANVSEADTLKVVNLVRTIVNVTVEGLTSLKSAKSEIEQIRIPGSKGIIRGDLKGLSISSSLLQAMADRAPVELSAEAAQLQASVNQAFEEAMKIFA